MPAPSPTAWWQVRAWVADAEEAPPGECASGANALWTGGAPPPHAASGATACLHPVLLQACKLSVSLPASGSAPAAGDMNWLPLDGEDKAVTLPPGWVDVWLALRPSEPGWTYDSQVSLGGCWLDWTVGCAGRRRSTSLAQRYMQQRTAAAYGSPAHTASRRCLPNFRTLFFNAAVALYCCVAAGLLPEGAQVWPRGECCCCWIPLEHCLNFRCWGAPQAAASCAPAACRLPGTQQPSALLSLSLRAVPPGPHVLQAARLGAAGG